VSLDQRIQLTQTPWKERNLLSEAAGLPIHLHHNLEKYQLRSDVLDITMNKECEFIIQPTNANITLYCMMQRRPTIIYQ